MGRREYLKAIYNRYHRSGAEQKGTILDEFCEVCSYNRKYAIRLLNGPPPEARPRSRRTRGPSYGRTVIQVLAQVWEAAGYPWSVRLKAMLPIWLPWLRQRKALTPELERPARHQPAPDRPPSPAPQHPDQDRSLGRHPARLHRDRPGLPLRQLRRG